jgi:type II secretory pathway component PulK
LKERTKKTATARQGIVLVAVLLVAALVAVIAAGLMFRMRAEAAAAAAEGRGEQAWQAANSGLARAMAVLKSSSSDRTVWYDNPVLFQNQLVADDGANRWYFTVWAEDTSQPTATVRYGAIDEAGKINLNSAGAETLLKLPNMTSDLVDSLLDWRDADSDVRPQGAEQEYYDSLETPYTTANGPLATLEELLLVKGFSARIIYGEDANQNGLLDPNEDDGDASFPPDNHDGVLDRGLKGAATVFSAEPNVDSAGKPRLNLNAAPPAAGSGLPQKTVDFIRLYLAEGGKFKHPSELLEMKYKLKDDHAADEAGAAAGTGGGGNGKGNGKGKGKGKGGGTSGGDLKAGQEIDSGVTATELAILLDRFTTASTGSGALVKGLVNVNSAPVEVLAALPGLDANLAQRIVDARRDLDATATATPAWLVSQNLLDAATFKTAAPQLTSRSFQFTVRCIGFGVPCGRFRVLEATVDLSGSAPRLINLRDNSRLGLPFPLNVDSQQVGSPQGTQQGSQ